MTIDHQGSPENPLGIRVIDHLKFYVDDVEKWAEFHQSKLGMYRRAIGNPSTGLEGQKAIVTGQGRINFMFIQAEGNGPKADEVRRYVDQHGCGVKDIAFRVDDVERAMAHAISQGAQLDHDVQSTDGLVSGGIKAYGDTVHTFLRRSGRNFFPGMTNDAGGVEMGEIHLMVIDHIVANVERMEEWVEFYSNVFGFDETAHFDIKTSRSALMSKVVGDHDGYIRLPINEPSSGNSQIQEFLDEFRGGVFSTLPC